MQLFYCEAYRDREDNADGEVNLVVAAPNADRAYEMYFDWMCEDWPEGEEDVKVRYESIMIFRIPPVPSQEMLIHFHEKWPDGCALVKSVDL